MLKRTVIHEVSWCRANSTVLMGEKPAAMSPVVAEITLESKTLLSRVTWGKDMAMRTVIFITVLLIVTIAKALKTSSVHSGRDDVDLFWSGENLYWRRKNSCTIGEVDRLSVFSGNGDGGFILVIIIVSSYSSGGLKKRGGGDLRGE